MNKGLRNEVTKRKHQQVCSILNIDPSTHYIYKAQAKPCSCSLCSPYKYSRKIKHKNLQDG